MYRVIRVLTDEEIGECRKIAASAPFVDGRISNPHNTAKQNEQLHDPTAYQKSSDLLAAGAGAQRGVPQLRLSRSLWPRR